MVGVRLLVPGLTRMAIVADAIERQLAHVPDNKIRAVYNRAEYLPDRKKMLQDWADWLDSCGFMSA